MSPWTIAAVQMDCRLGDVAHNLAQIRARLSEAATAEAQLVVFPECILSGYGFESKDEAWPFAETIPGPLVETLTGDCRRLNVFAAVGLLERAGTDLFNSCVLVGPHGLVGSYRKIHLPFLGVDRFTTPGDRPFAVHDLGGLRVGMAICYDGSFPECARCLMLLGADLIVLPTNWPTGALPTINHLVQARALENQVFFAGVNRIGAERGFQFVGRSRIINVNGDLLAESLDEQPTILTATIDPQKSRNKRLVLIPGEYELDRLAHRRPEMYGPLTEPVPGGWRR